MTAAFSPRLDAALAFAARAHRSQVRKGTDVPYIVHPVQVSLILLRHGFDEDLAIAGVLHDTIEDCGASPDAIAAQFGDGVADLVLAVSETKQEGGQRRPWRARKEEQLAHLAAASARVAALKAADALHNAASTVADLHAHGPRAWARFNAGAEESLWYYREVARLCGERLGEHALAGELAAIVDEMARLSGSASA
jgi:(p)ppGpp synthase/HD superfamily hydrolase